MFVTSTHTDDLAITRKVCFLQILIAPR